LESIRISAKPAGVSSHGAADAAHLKRQGTHEVLLPFTDAAERLATDIASSK